MKYANLGRTGLSVSRICLGCMTYGDPKRGPQTWALNEEDSRPLIKLALERGVNFFDTANIYSTGASEEVLGRALKDFAASRDEVVIATKAWAPMRPGPNGGGLSRKALFQAMDDSLRRLGLDYVDLYQIHRWDYRTPIEETLEALNDLVRAGKTRYIGASSMHAWQFSKALHISKERGWSRFVSMQNHLNLLYREEEREMMPLCRDEGVGVIPWSPLARGRLARDWTVETNRTQKDEFARQLYNKTEENDREVVAALASVAEARGTPRAQVSLAWLLQTPNVVAPIIGVTKAAQLEDAIAALEVTLTDAEMKAMEAPYRPHPIVGFQ